MTREELDSLKEEMNTYRPYSIQVHQVIRALEAAWEERDKAIMEGNALTIEKDGLQVEIERLKEQRRTCESERARLERELFTKGPHKTYIGMEQEIEQLKTKLLELERGEYICRKCGLRKDGEPVDADF